MLGPRPFSPSVRSAFLLPPLASVPFSGWRGSLSVPRRWQSRSGRCCRFPGVGGAGFWPPVLRGPTGNLSPGPGLGESPLWRLVSLQASFVSSSVCSLFPRVGWGGVASGASVGPVCTFCLDLSGPWAKRSHSSCLSGSGPGLLAGGTPPGGPGHSGRPGWTEPGWGRPSLPLGSRG